MARAAAVPAPRPARAASRQRRVGGWARRAAQGITKTDHAANLRTNKAHISISIKLEYRQLSLFAHIQAGRQAAVQGGRAAGQAGSRAANVITMP